MDRTPILRREKLGAKVEVQLVAEYDGKPKVGFTQKQFEPKTVWLRMEFKDGKAKGLYRATE